MIRDKNVENSSGNIKEALYLGNIEGKTFLSLSHIRLYD